MDTNLAPVIGIAAEYNPFHNGHALHIARAREKLAEEHPCAPVVIALSSSFTQRGLPALADKWTRARMALENGADLVLELPFAYACNGGAEFARGAVDTLAAAGFVTHLSCGMETLAANTSSFIGTISDILIHEPPSFKLNLRKNLALGASYPKALALALELEYPGGGGFISLPNNSLALSYYLRIREKNYPLAFLPVLREGAGHHDAALGPLTSAGALRSALARHDRAGIAGSVPPSVFGFLREEQQRLCLGTEKLWLLLQGLLTRSQPEDLRRCAGMDEGMENLFLKHYAKAESYEDFIGCCVCARYTRGRLQRQAIRCLIGFGREAALTLSRGGPPYARLLGAGPRGRALLRAREKGREVPVITRLAAVRDPAGRLAADLEFRASRLRELLLPRPDLKREERQKPVFL